MIKLICPHGHTVSLSEDFGEQVLFGFDFGKLIISFLCPTCGCEYRYDVEGSLQ